MQLELYFENALIDFKNFYGYTSPEIIKAYRYYKQGNIKESAFAIRIFSAKSLSATPNELILWAEKNNKTNMSFMEVK